MPIPLTVRVIEATRAALHIAKSTYAPIREVHVDEQRFPSFLRDKTAAFPLKEKFTAFSWNIFHASERDEVLHTLDTYAKDADVIMLQETPLGFWENDIFADYNILYKASTAYDYKQHWMREFFPHQGNMIATKFPLTHNRILTFPALASRQHNGEVSLENALFVELGDFTLATTHLPIYTRPSYRAELIRRVLDVIDDTPALVGGDFNLLFRTLGPLQCPPLIPSDTNALRVLHEQGYVTPANPLWQTPPKCFDVLAAKGANLEVAYLPILGGSDHYAMRARVTLSSAE